MIYYISGRGDTKKADLAVKEKFDKTKGSRFEKACSLGICVCYNMRRLLFLTWPGLFQFRECHPDVTLSPCY